MSYVRSILDGNEQVLLSARLHWINYSRTVFLVFIAVITVVAAVLMPKLYLFLLAVIFVALALLALTRSLFAIKSTELAITDRRVIYKTGLLQRHTMEQQLNRIDSVSVDQTFLGRLLNYGEVEIRGSGNSFTPTHKISHPLEFRKSVQYGIDNLSQALNYRGRN
jgi:uncharacterized membrane protein YdbT with pleckstrin-like domain